MRLPRQRMGRGEGGFSLIELMVAVVVSAIVMAGVIEIFINQRAGARVQNSLAELQENARYSLEQLSRVARMNGYQGDAPGAWVLGPLTQSNGGIKPLAGTNNDTSGSDTLTVTFMGSADGFIKDCQGNVVNATTTAINVFSISANSELQCAVSTDAGTTFQTLVLSPRVEAMDILYGEDTDSDDSANSYLRATDVTDMDNVVSIRVAMLFATTTDNLAAQVDGVARTLLDNVVPAANDRRLRRIVAATIKLRNHL